MNNIITQTKLGSPLVSLSSHSQLHMCDCTNVCKCVYVYVYVYMWEGVCTCLRIWMWPESTQASSNTWIFPRKHKVVIIMTWVQHNNTTMNTVRAETIWYWVPPLVWPMEYFPGDNYWAHEDISTRFWIEDLFKQCMYTFVTLRNDDRSYWFLAKLLEFY